MKFKASLFSSTIAPLTLLIASTNAVAATIDIIGTGSAGTFDSVTDAWSIDITGAGTLDISLIRADYSEEFGWTLSGDKNGSGTVYGPAPSPSGTGAIDILLGSWTNDSSGAKYLFTATNYPSSSSPVDYKIKFFFTYDESDALGSSVDRLVVAPSAVPLPAAAWLFASGLLGVLGLARRSKAA